MMGVFNFSESGVSAKEVRGSLLGGEFRARGEGGPEGGKVSFSGRLAVPELRSWWPHSAMRHVQGGAAYSGTLAFDEKARLALDVESDLQGLSFAFPPPLRKAAEAQWPMRLSLSSHDEKARRLTVSVPQRGALDMTFLPPADSRPARILRAGVGIGSPANPQPGLRLDVRADQFDLDAWQEAIGEQETSGKSGGARGEGRDEVIIDGPVAAHVQAGEIMALGHRLEQGRLVATRT